MSHPKRHHYLPETYLKGFSADGRGLWVYHMGSHKLVPQTISDTCVQSYYNAFENEDGTKNFEIETKLSQVEGDAAAIIKDIDDSKQITAEQKASLAFFVSLQRLRTPEFEGDVNRSAAHMMTRMMKMTLANEERAQAALDQFAESTGTQHGLTAKEMVDFGATGDFSLDVHRNLSLDMMVKMAPGFGDYFNQMEWAFLRAPAGCAFITTDSPFMLLEPSDWRKNGRPLMPVGLLTKGAKKFLPLSAKTCLVMFDKGDKMTFRDATAEVVKGLNEQLAAFAFRFVIGSNEEHMRTLCAHVRSLLDAKNAKWGGSKLIIG